MKNIKFLFLLLMSQMCLISCASAALAPIETWMINTDGNSTVTVSQESETVSEIEHDLKGDYGWAELVLFDFSEWDAGLPIVFKLKAKSNANMELKLVDKDGSVFGRKFSLRDKKGNWSEIVVFQNTLDYWWGGDELLDEIASFNIAISGTGAGSVLVDSLGIGTADMNASFSVAGPVLDSARNLDGIGFKQRRDAELIPEDPLVIEFLKQIQDTASLEKQLVSSQEDVMGQTFNNAIAAIAFILKAERERAERILDFFANRIDKDNIDPFAQQFFFNGEARGFYQNVLLKKTFGREAYQCTEKSDRWTGDMAWLLIAYIYYEREYKSEKYLKVRDLLKNLLIDFFQDAPSGGGYVQHGWRKEDSKLHEGHGHPEINIDCYAAFELLGEKEYSAKIKTWLDGYLGNKSNLWLDQYTWRVLAFGPEYKDRIDVPEFDLRYRKTIEHNGEQVVGFYHAPDIDMNNLWLDGTGHISVGFMQCGEMERGYFYANQLDKFIMEREIGGILTHAIPYTANSSGEYSWVNTKKGFVSVACWYIFAKNKFNPMKLEKY